MSKIDIDNKKMWESVIKCYRNHHPVYKGCGDIFDDALNDQGLEYKNGEIVRMEPSIPEIVDEHFFEMLGNDENKEMNDFQKYVDYIISDDKRESLGFYNACDGLLYHARKALHSDEELERAYKNQDKVVYQRGYKKGWEEAHKQVVDDLISIEDVDKMVDHFCPAASDCLLSIYRKGIEDTLKFIKGERI